MLRSVKDLEGYAIQATDGIIGHAKDFYFDDEAWGIRFLVVNTRNWWLGHQVLVEPKAIEGVSSSAELVSLSLTRQAVKEAPIYKANTSSVGEWLPSRRNKT